ncbi:MAG TPA: molybdenum cofactor guanylyltransferase [Cellvibrionaceae bacterium]|nr:molybdenum cofactor guanylyltransferase [Cellvibrionaceae bacterium]HMY40806.1 molybdenum cofactor guanylyltransferase [Marinagarivorans sp.]HNG61205.1 molybdenum cofactor guanylyltransferase [Cellvibrionaceae bacterium]
MPKDPSRFSKNTLLAVILCGGASSRMGQDKATLCCDGQMLWQQVAKRLAPQVGQLLVSTSARQAALSFAPYPCVVDGQVAAGPLGGISSALASPLVDGFDWVVFSSCDTPLQPTDWVAALAAARAGNRGISYIRYQGQAHYLHALWHRSLLKPLEEFLQAGGRAVHRFYAQVQAQPVDYAPLAAPPIDPFSNLNSPADLARIKPTYD